MGAWLEYVLVWLLLHIWGEGRTRGLVMTGAPGYLIRPGKVWKDQHTGKPLGHFARGTRHPTGAKVSSGQCGWYNPVLCSICPHSEGRIPHVTPWPESFLAGTQWTLLRHLTPRREEREVLIICSAVKLYSGACDHHISFSYAALACTSPAVPLGCLH